MTRRSWSTFPLNDKRRNFVSLGLRTALSGGFNRLDVSRDVGGGTAIQLNTQRRLFGFNILSEHAEIFDFTSETIRESTDALTRRTRTRLDATIPAFFVLPRLPFNVTIARDARESGREAYQVANRISAFLIGASFEPS